MIGTLLDGRYEISQLLGQGAMGAVYERFQFLRRAIAAIGSKRQDAVVTPVAPTGKIVDRHQLDGSDAELREFVRFR